MENVQVKFNAEVELVFNKYPDSVRKKISGLRSLILEVANEIEGVKYIEETLKWGEPNYVTKHGSTIRIDWKKKTPDQYAMYFTCTTDLVPTFRRIYSDVFEFEGNRAIVFQMEDRVPKAVLRKCISAALRYHKVKQLPMLGL